MTAILRILNVVVNGSSSIDVSFTANLTRLLTPGNVSIISQSANVPNSNVQQVSVSGNTLSITCQPLTEFAAYQLQFQSVPNFPFISVNGDAQISMDGVSNTTLITGPLSADNPVFNYFQSFYQNNIYKVSDPTTIVSSYLQGIAVAFSRALYDIRQVKNENYLSFTIIDELHQRGSGPLDRLFEEAAYEVFRVGLTPTRDPSSTTNVYADFPTYPITLQAQSATEQIKASSSATALGTFDINTLTFNLSNTPITRVNSIVFTLTTIHPVYTYDLSTLGYQLFNSEYDQDFASSYLRLANNKVKLNDAILSDPNFSLSQIFSITIQYEYKGLGIDVDPASVGVFSTRQAVREVLPPIINIFSLQHAPITDASNNTPTIGGVVFTNPNTNNGSPHPAFLTEIGFSLSALPSLPGVYAIDYPNAKVYVYGADTTNDGTGPSPPLATYYYRLTYTSQTDYVYDADALNLVALPLGNLVGNAATVFFNFEQALIPGVDFTADTHIEAINEPINNRLTSLNVLTTINSPITNVFQIYNQSSGEIYRLNRWDDNLVYFAYNQAPRIQIENGENTSFLTIVNELLGVNTTSTNTQGQRIFTIDLINNTIVASTQDGIGSSVNSSVVFTNGNVFMVEKWYNRQIDAISNINELSFPGQYLIDYTLGIVYVAVSNTQDSNLGTVSYKSDTIIPRFPHVISVDDIYFRISILNPKNKQFPYLSFADGAIVPAILLPTDEDTLNGVATSPYQILNGMVGAFVDEVFVPGVSNAIKFVRGLFVYDDLGHSTAPINFATVCVSSNFNITVGSLTGQSYQNVVQNGSQFSVSTGLNVPYLSSAISYIFTVVRSRDGADLWTGGGTIAAGDPLTLILPGTNTPINGDLVSVSYSFSILPVERVVVDYNKGDFFIDYTYLADEILVSYEYGDNVLDFRQGNMSVGTNYYVSYKVGALRDALLANFGTLVNVPLLSNFDLQLDRERYREALQAALSSFIQGPTVAAIKNICRIITHIEPQVIESAFQIWSLGSNLLSPEGVQTTGNTQLLPARYNNGVLINNTDQTVSMPISSNLRLEEGTFETWLIPRWNGLDNDAILTFNIQRDGSTIAPYRVFLGASGQHPTLDTNGNFVVSKSTGVIAGKPNTNKDGVYLYYAPDPVATNQRWYVEVIDGYVSTPNNHSYNLSILSSGKFYDVKYISDPNPSNMTRFTGTSKVSLKIAPLSDGYGIDQGITFISDQEHFILDFGQHKSNRLSIFKDVSGYINFRALDKNGVSYAVSADISSWIAGQAHMIAASWKLNTRNSRDEMHLFIDGLEVPNIIKYGQRNLPYLHEKFRTISQEEIVGLANRDIVGSDDLTTTQGSAIVSSSINFSQFNIQTGDLFFINEAGFSPTGYHILNINGQTLTLDANMPSTLAGNGRFSANQTSFTVSSEITVAPNLTVSTVHVLTQGSDLSSFMGSAMVSSTGTNFQTAGILPGFLLRIENDNFPLTSTVLQVSGHSLTLDNSAVVSLSGLSFFVYPNQDNEIPGVRALDPAYSISQDANFNSILTIYNDVLENDLVLIHLLGLNFRDVSKPYYVWSTGLENVLMTRLPAPISLDRVDITRTILSSTVIGSSNSTLMGGIFVSNPIPVAQPSNNLTGRTISATISGTNVDFITPVSITIDGYTTGNTPATQTITFSDYGMENFSLPFVGLISLQVDAKPLNPARNALAVSATETFPITQPEFDGYAAVIKYSYPILGGYTLSSDGGNTISDGYNLFSGLDIGNTLVIRSPSNVAGFYGIAGLSADRHSITLTTSLPAFDNGVYQILNTTQSRTGLQNGFFTLEIAGQPGVPWFLTAGFYQVSFATYMSVKFAPLTGDLFFGSDAEGNNQANAILDRTSTFSIMMTDTRIGEVVAANKRSITKDFNSIKPPIADKNTLVLLNYDSLPFTNQAGFYADTSNEYQHFQSDFAVNDNFGQSLVFLDTPVVLDNTGILDARKQGTIEFWMSPLYDMTNDPNTRYYFDAFGAVVERVVSVSNVAVKISAPASQILGVFLASDTAHTLDYFAGGSLDIDTQHAIQEEGSSIGNSMVMVSQPVLRVISVQIAGDATGKDYFAGGTIGQNGTTIYFGTPLPVSNVSVITTYQSTNNDNKTLNTQVIRLNRRLPAQNSQVIVKYLPAGLQGDRFSIFKDTAGYVNFSITASGTEFTIRAPTLWSRNTWHRIKASYRINGGIGSDNMRLFLDGYQYTDVLSGQGQLVGQFPFVLGSVSVGDGYSILGSINVKDPINTLWVGSDYSGANPIFTLIDNFRISNISRPIYAPYGEPIDVNYSSNLATVFPVVSDLYTTYLIDFDIERALITNFATLVDVGTGAFDFTVNIFDEFNIVKDSPLVRQILENLIQILKPANTVAFLHYK